MLSVLLHKARQPPELASGPGEFDGARRDTAAPGTEELAREAVEAGIRRYCATRRERIPEFVDRNFSLRAAVRLHRAAFGWDMLRAPVNLTMAAPAAALHTAAAGARRFGAERVANTLGRRRLLLSTSVADRVEWLVCTDLLELPCQAGDRVSTRDALAETILTDPRVITALRAMLTSLGLKDDDPLRPQALERTLAEYAVTRGTAAEITTGLMTLSAGALTLGKLTPGAVSFGPMLASIVAQQAAISSFPLGGGSAPSGMRCFQLCHRHRCCSASAAGCWRSVPYYRRSQALSPILCSVGLVCINGGCGGWSMRWSDRCWIPHHPATRCATVMSRACSMCSIWSPRHTGSRVKRFAAHPNSRCGTEAASSTTPERLSSARISRRNPASLNRA